MTAPVSLARGRAPLPPVEDRVLPRDRPAPRSRFSPSPASTPAPSGSSLHGVPATEVAFVRYAVHLAVVCAVGLAGAERVWEHHQPPRRQRPRRRASRQHPPQLRGALLPAPDHDRGDHVLGAPVDLPALDPAPRREGRPAAAGRRWRVGFCGILIVARPWTGHLHPAILALPRRRALRRALLDPDPHARRPRPDQHPAVLRRPRRHPRRRPLRPRRLDLADRRGELARLRRHRRLRLERPPARHHRPPFRARLDARALQLRPDRLYDGVELADLRPAAGPLGDPRRRRGRGERALHRLARTGAGPGKRGERP